MPTSPKLSVYIITYNERERLREALASVAFADEIIVVDSNSTDGTIELSLQMGAKVVQVPFTTFGELRNRGIAACQYDWIFSLDTDERCTPKAQAEILRIIEDPAALDVYHVPRQNWFMGRWIKHSGWYPDYRQPQLFRKGAMHYTDDAVHETYIKDSPKPIGYLQEPIWQIPFENLSQLMHKANRYSSLSVTRVRAKGKRPSMWGALGHGVWSFIKIYVFKRGFLDGWPGFVLGVGSFYGSFFRYAKYYEQEKTKPKP